MTGHASGRERVCQNDNSSIYHVAVCCSMLQCQKMSGHASVRERVCQNDN